MESKTKDSSKAKEAALENILLVSSSPHIRSNESTQRIMLDVIIALTPAMIGSVYFFGLAALKLLLISVASSVFFEAVIQKLFQKEITITDLSAVITGILLAFNLPASAPWWLAVIGSGFAIIIVKQFFGGLGSNFMNPALAGRAMLLTSWPSHMSTFTGTLPDVVATATPLSIMKYGASSSAVEAATSATQSAGAELPSLMNMFVGNIPGALGETSAMLLLIGAVYLIIRQVIDWKIPVVYIGTTVVMLLLLGIEMEFIPYHIFGLGAGVLTAIIRVHGGYPEGVSYSILLMNVASPLIDRLTGPKIFGEVK